jgi:hypothetical protein
VLNLLPGSVVRQWNYHQTELAAPVKFLASSETRTISPISVEVRPEVAEDGDLNVAKSGYPFMALVGRFCRVGDHHAALA